MCHVKPSRARRAPATGRVSVAPMELFDPPAWSCRASWVVLAAYGHELVVGDVQADAGVGVVNIERCGGGAARAVGEGGDALLTVALEDACALGTPCSGRT